MLRYHDPSSAPPPPPPSPSSQDIADQVVIFNRGRIEQRGTPKVGEGRLAGSTASPAGGGGCSSSSYQRRQRQQQRQHCWKQRRSGGGSGSSGSPPAHLCAPDLSAGSGPSAGVSLCDELCGRCEPRARQLPGVWACVGGCVELLQCCPPACGCALLVLRWTRCARLTNPPCQPGARSSPAAVCAQGGLPHRQALCHVPPFRCVGGQQRAARAADVY